MAKKLFIGGLPYATTDDQLKEHFSAAGTVASAQIIVDKFSGRSKGFGFIEMSSDEEADKAIEMFNGQDFGGRSLVVNEARPKTEGPRTGGRGGFGGGSRGGSRGGFGGGGRRDSY
ncbi:MAG TPA: RNA-binding protein [Patescibacteria group bacterium]|jgi:RNA recognition motif-containing protein|nr:RNA-binding protein [Patescibacteria group bacterium]